LYSIATKSDSAVTDRSAPRDWDKRPFVHWSPDSKRLALTLGHHRLRLSRPAPTECSSPTLDRKLQTKASKATWRLEPVFSPDGSSVAFVDFSDSPARLFRFDITTGARSLIQRATEETITPPPRLAMIRLKFISTPYSKFPAKNWPLIAGHFQKS